MTTTVARRWHLLTAAVAVFALGLQLVLVINGEPILEDTEVPALGYRLGRFFSYFTIQSNLLVAVATVLLARDPARDGAGWRVLRLARPGSCTVSDPPPSRPRGLGLHG